jgi:hypothetical protein
VGVATLGSASNEGHGSFELSRKRAALDQSALVSTVFHAHLRDMPQVMPRFLKPMPLEAAIAHLEKRHPILRDHAAAWMVNPPESREALATRGLLERLVGYEGASVATEGAETQDGEDTAAKLLRGRDESDEVSIWRYGTGRFSRALRALRAKTSGAGFDRNAHSLTIRFDPVSLVTEVIATVVVNRPATDFTAIADACGWAQRLPLFFQSSNLGTFRAGQFAPLVPPPTPGAAPYSDKDLLERVNLSLNPFFPMAAENVLRASHDQSASLHEGDVNCGLRVSLQVCLSTRVGPSAQPGGIDVDSGEFSATPLEDAPDGTKRTQLRGTKRARFTKRYVCGWEVGYLMNQIAPVLLGPWMALLVFESAYAPTE